MRYQRFVLFVCSYEQKVSIEGKRKDAPIVLTLHGVPGTPIPFSVVCRGLFPIFANEFFNFLGFYIKCKISKKK